MYIMYIIYIMYLIILYISNFIFEIQMKDKYMMDKQALVGPV